MPPDDPQPGPTVHLLVVRGGHLGTVRTALERLGVDVEVLAAPPSARDRDPDRVLRVGPLA